MAFTLILLICSLGCAGYSIGPPSVPPSQPNVISLDPRDWYILYSAGMAAHPSPNAAGVWSFPFPSAGHVNYIQTPFTAATIPHSVSLTFRVDSTAPQYEVIDPNDVLPATVHIFFEQQNDNLSNPDGRWWADPSVYNLGSQDNETITMIVPLNPTHWSNVYGLSDPQSFYAALNNVGWIGVTCGGQYFWGHGITLGSGAANYILVDFQVK